MKTIQFTLLTILFFGVFIHVRAQDPTAPCDPFDPSCTPVEPPPEEQIPIDGGISLLAIGGVAWGIKRLRDKK